MGVILYEMLLSITPFCSTTVEDLFEEITNGEVLHCTLSYSIVKIQLACCLFVCCLFVL